jgi:aminopeptidase-like protein
MYNTELKNSTGFQNMGQKMYSLITELFPICRSITGDGVRQTLSKLQELIPLNIHEVPSGTRVFDWTVPKEWNIRDAYIKDSNGERVIDFRKSNLHVVNYSVPIRKKMALAELKGHIFTLPDHPDWIPYRTSYYKEDWGFCLSHNQLLGLKDEEYEVCIDSSLKDGYLTYGEYFLQGATEDEFLVSCHVCHPSLCNDNLSGIALATYFAKSIASLPLRYSYRFLFIPGTIGSITWLALNDRKSLRIKHGLVMACVGDSGKTSYKKSRRADADIDKAVIHILKETNQDYDIIDFFPYGYDERQYCSPGFNLPVGCLMRTPHGQFPEYHTSADNLDFVKPEFLQDSFLKCLAIVNVIENNRKYLNQNPKCEPQLGRRGLYEAIGGNKESATSQLAMLWILNLSDGNNSLLDIAERSGIRFEIIRNTTNILLKHNLIVECQ